MEEGEDVWRQGLHGTFNMDQTPLVSQGSDNVANNHNPGGRGNSHKQKLHFKDTPAVFYLSLRTLPVCQHWTLLSKVYYVPGVCF